MSAPVSIVIPTYARPRALRRCLQSLSNVHEVIVVDDGSPEPPPDGLLGARVIRQSNQGPAAARNLGARQATGKFLAFLDDDCVAEEGWLDALLEAWRPRRLLGARTKNMDSANRCAEFNQWLLDALVDWWISRNSSWQFLPSNNWLLDREEFLRAGGFAGGFPLAASEDREFCGRWRRQGGELHCVSDRLVGHHHAQTLARFASMHFRYGRGAAMLRRGQAQEAVDRGMYMHLLRTSPHPGLLCLSQLAALSGLAYETSRSFLSSGRT